jgi:hypothetical protein
MSLVLTRCFGLGIAVVAFMCGALPHAGAAAKLTDFNGVWQGAGTDRNSPLERAQQTSCQMRIRADQSHLTSDTVCHGQAGLSKVLQFAVTLDGDRFSGSAGQTSTTRGSATSDTLKGAVSGQKTEDTANLHIVFPGLTPNAEVVLKLIDPSTFSMHVASHGLTLMDLLFHRQAAHKPP